MFRVADILEVFGTRVPQRCAVYTPSAAATLDVPLAR